MHSNARFPNREKEEDDARVSIGSVQTNSGKWIDASKKKSCKEGGRKKW